MKHRLDAVDEQLVHLLADRPRQVLELQRASGVAYSTIRRRLTKLAKYGLILHPRYKPCTVTAEGFRWLEECNPPLIEAGDDQLDELLSLLPTGYHRALFRLAVDVVIAKATLLEEYSSGWPSLFVWGQTKSSKTLTGKALVRLFQLRSDDVVCVLYPNRATPGSPGVRRYQAKGGTWNVAASPHFDHPLILLDEYDKLGDTDTKRSIISFLDDNASFKMENTVITNHAVPYLTANKPKENCLKDDFLAPFVRRSFALDTDFLPLRGQLNRVAIAGKELADMMKSVRMPRIDLAKIHPLLKELSQQDWKFTDKLIATSIKEECAHLIDTEPVVRAVLGRITRTNTNVREAIYRVVFDRLTLFETLDGTKEGWQEHFTSEWAGYRAKEQPAEIRARVDARSRYKAEQEEELTQRNQRLARGVQEKIQAQLNFAERKGDRVGRLKQLKTDLWEKPRGADAKSKTAGLRSAIGRAIEITKACRTQERLDETTPEIDKLITRAEAELDRLVSRQQQEDARQSLAKANRKALEDKRRKIAKRIKDIDSMMELKQNFSSTKIIHRLQQVGAIQRATRTRFENVPPPISDQIFYGIELIEHKLKEVFSRPRRSESVYHDYEAVRSAAYCGDLSAKYLLEHLSQGGPDVVRLRDGRHRTIRTKVSPNLTASNPNPPSPPEWATIEHTEQVWRGCDGKIYQDADFDCLFSPAVRAVLQARKSRLHSEWKALEARLGKL